MRARPRPGASIAAGAIVLLASMMTGCSTIGYYAQAARGQWALLSQARPIDEWLADPSTPEDLKRRLRLARDGQVVLHPMSLENPTPLDPLQPGVVAADHAEC